MDNREATEMERRVAQIFCAAKGACEGRCAAENQECATWHWAENINPTRTIIRAMRESTQAMLEAGSRHIRDEHGAWDDSALKLAWQAMIDAASPPEVK